MKRLRRQMEVHVVLGGDGCAIENRGAEAPILHGSEGFFIDAVSHALNDFHSGYGTIALYGDFDDNVALVAEREIDTAEVWRRINYGKRRLDVVSLLHQRPHRAVLVAGRRIVVADIALGVGGRCFLRGNRR